LYIFCTAWLWDRGYRYPTRAWLYP